MRRGLLLIGLLLGGCPADEDPTASDGSDPLGCGSARTQQACTDKQVSASQAEDGCAWVDIRAVDATCASSASEAVGTCIPTQFIGDGCEGESCNDQTGRLFARENADGTFDVFETDLCGEEPVGYTLCRFGDDDPAGCGCVCESLGGRSEAPGEGSSSSSG